MLENFAPEISQNSTEQHEEWHKVHAQLLKSVADAQAKLLAAQNETCDKLSGIEKDLAVIAGRLSGRLDGIGAVLAELLQPKSSASLPKSYRTQPKAKRRR